MQGIEARGDGHELAVHAHQATRAPAHVRVFEGGDVAQALEPHCFSDEAHVAALEAVPLAFAAQGLDHHPGEHAKALVQGVAHGGTGRLRQDRGADEGRHQNAQGDFQHPPYRRHERLVRVLQHRQADHRRGVAGQHEAIGAEGAVAHGTGRAQAYPQGQAGQEQLGVLREYGDQRHHHRRAGQGAEHPVEALGEHMPALRLHDDEHGDHRRARLRQLQAHGQPQGDERSGQHLEDVHPGHPVGARPGKEAPAPFQALQPAHGQTGSAHSALSGFLSKMARVAGVFGAAWRSSFGTS
ncbi:hypothetical protein D3C79_703690 [compost metagenome]